MIYDLKDKEYCREWIFKFHKYDLQMYLDEFFEPEDHGLKFHEAINNPQKYYIILKDYLMENSEKLDYVLKELLSKNSYIVMLLGGRGSGKTSCVMHLGENCRFRKPIYWLGMPNPKFPDWIIFTKLIDKIPSGSIAIIDEAQLRHFSRDFKKRNPEENISKTLTILRHKGVTVIFISQNSALMDLNIIRMSDVILVKPFSLLQRYTEREVIVQTLIHEMLPRKKSQTYYLGSIDNESMQLCFDQPLPNCWSEQVSKSFQGFKNEEEKQKLILQCKNLGYSDEEIQEYVRLRGS